jgi:hypothetical protein
MPMSNKKLTKSLYVQGCQCKKALWLQKHKSNVMTELPEGQKNNIEIGNEAGRCARQLFPNGKEILRCNSDTDNIQQTKEWLDEGENAIYEATFELNGVLVMVDILHRNKQGNFEIYEVKGSTWNSNKKYLELEKYFSDVAIQYYVLNGCGLTIDKAYVMLLNSDYTRGCSLDIQQLFVDIDVTKDVVALQNDIPQTLDIFKELLAKTNCEPLISIGAYCNKPQVCKAIKYCWEDQSNIPEFSVFDIFNRGKNSKAWDLYKSGLKSIVDIPDDCDLTQAQQLKLNASKSGNESINIQAIKKFLNTLKYPLYHLDFETFTQAIPKIEGVSPFQQIPFQYSLHIEEEAQALGETTHEHFLGKGGTDPREKLVMKLLNDIPEGSTIVAYNSSFEIQVLQTLAKQFPQYSGHLSDLCENMVDLADPFRSLDYYTPKMQGKYSIKVVLPLLVPEMKNAYNDLNLVHDGIEAMQAFSKLVEMEDENQIQEYRSALLEYCKLDTWSMVKILEVLRNSV